MRPITDLTGLKFGRLTITGLAQRGNRGQVQWNCKCECGNYTKTDSAELKRRSINKSCGCYRIERLTLPKDSHKVQGLNPDIPYGYCHCGCGGKTKIATSNCRPENKVVGEPMRFLPHHHIREAKYHPNYKGGRRKTSSGYIEIYSPDHPYANVRKTVLEHILVMESHVGRYITKLERIHHINHIKHDNRLDNLYLCKNHAEHMSIHKKERRSAYVGMGL